MMINRYSIVLLILLGWVNLSNVQATEGMWIPALLKSLNEDDMHSMGLEIPAEAIYSINEGSLKDAIVHFGGGCTAEVISPTGLILTNHHCGYGSIQQHSSVENDLLTNGFWAANHGEELPNPGLTATFVVRMEDVTASVYERLNAAKEGESLSKIAADVCKALAEKAKQETGLDAEVKPFNFGNSYFMILTRTFSDVRLVGAPPSAIGKFGGDTDNWVWPRHTGDFSLFRIYADAGNEPSEFKETNLPWRAPVHLPVSLDGVEEGDFCMVFGFPGYTEQFLIADAVDHLVNSLNPGRIQMRDESLAVINAARASSAELRIRYAATQSGIANAWKKWIGQNQGLLELGAVQIKRDFEAEYVKRAKAAKHQDYIDALNKLIDKFKVYEPYLEARNYFVEYYYYGPKIFSLALKYSDFANNYEQLVKDGKDQEALDELKASARAYYASTDPVVEKELLNKLTPLFLNALDDSVSPSAFSRITATFQRSGDPVAFDQVLTLSMFSDSTALFRQLGKFSARGLKKWKADPALQSANALMDWYQTTIRSPYSENRNAMDEGMQFYIKGMMELFPEKTFWFDANSTLRLTYGKVEGSAPWDGMSYDFYTTADGILQKYKPGHPDFDLPSDLVQKLKHRDYGVYAHSDGELRVCFTGSNHTTGGNSGSPALNARGELIGLNFDRSWESTMSDVMFDPARCRNIMVDIRYVLWVIDKYAGAGHLIQEMTLVKGPAEKPEMDLPTEQDRNAN